MECGLSLSVYFVSQFLHPAISIDLFGANSNHVQSRLKINVTPIIAYTGNTPWWERATIAQSLYHRSDMPTKQRYSKKSTVDRLPSQGNSIYGWQLFAIVLLCWHLRSAQICVTAIG